MGNVTVFGVNRGFHRGYNAGGVRGAYRRRQNYIGVALCGHTNGARRVVRNGGMRGKHVFRRHSNFVSREEGSTFRCLQRSGVPRHLFVNGAGRFYPLVLPPTSKLSPTTRCFHGVHHVIDRGNGCNHERVTSLRVGGRERPMMSRRGLGRRQYSTRRVSMHPYYLARRASFKGACRNGGRSREGQRRSNGGGCLNKGTGATRRVQRCARGMVRGSLFGGFVAMLRYGRGSPLVVRRLEVVEGHFFGEGEPTYVAPTRFFVSTCFEAVSLPGRF